MFSIIIVGTTRENIINKIMPGITNAIRPTIIRIPVMMLTARSNSSFDMVKLKLVRRFAWLFSRVSMVYFMLIPWTM